MKSGQATITFSMAISAGVGWLGVLMAVGFWGTWASTLKAKSVAESKVDSLILQVRPSVSCCWLGPVAPVPAVLCRVTSARAFFSSVCYCSSSWNSGGHGGRSWAP